MSEVRLNVLDAGQALCGVTHGSVGDAAVAALSAEPETIEELQDAMARFIKPIDDLRPFAAFDAGTRDEPWDAGIVCIDLAARVVAAESTYSMPSAEGRVQYHDGTQATDIWLPYYLPDDWLFVDSVAEFEPVCEQRRAERAASPPIDARPILYGAVVEFIVKQCLKARDAKARDPIAEIHAEWLMTPRSDLRGQSPRGVMLAKLDFVDADLQTREMQWSLLGAPAPCLKPDSAAYRFAGFGTHEVVLYYELLRLLLRRCWKRVSKRRDVSMPGELARLEQIKTEWLERPEPDSGGRNPAYILECERKRLPLIVSAEEIVLDEDCPLCRMMREQYRLTFCHLDGCNMDEGFPFSFCRTRDEWEEEERRRKQLDEEFDKEWERRKGEPFDDGRPRAGDDRVIH